MLSCFGHDDTLCAEFRNRARDLARERPRVRRVVEFHITDAHALPFKAARKGAHRGEHKGDLLLVMPDIGRLGRDFGHEHDILARIKVAQRCYVRSKLVSQHESQGFGHTHLTRRGDVWIVSGNHENHGTMGKTANPPRKRKPYLPTKLCAACGRSFAWRKKWARDWDQVRYCSDRCRAARHTP